MKQGVGVSHAKTILLGEHSVVYGNPAIAFPIMGLSLTAEAKYVDGPNWLDTPFYKGEVPPRAQNGQPLEKILAETAFRNVLTKFPESKRNIKINVSGYIPPARGLGSSAAVAVAVIRAIAQLKETQLSETEQFNLVQEVEKVAHGTPSGLDAYATSKVVPIWFEKGNVKNLILKRKPPILVADTGVQGRTVEAVSIVRKKRDANKKLIDKKFQQITEYTHTAGKALENGDLNTLGLQMVKNHEVLQSLDVSNLQLDNLVQSALAAGAVGAKLTGAGLGGCIVALCESEKKLPILKDALLSAGAAAVWNVY